jgi:hypothetical protein
MGLAIQYFAGKNGMFGVLFLGRHIYLHRLIIDEVKEGIVHTDDDR